MGLIDLCIDEIRRSSKWLLVKQAQKIPFLPSILKQKIIKKLIEYNLLNDTILTPFLDKNTIELNLSCSNIMLTDNSLQLISKNCTNLKTISLFRCYSFTKKGLIDFFQRSTKLENCRLEKCISFDEEVLNIISEYCLNLKHIDLTRTRLSEESLLNLSKKQTNLTSLLLFASGKTVSNKFLNSLSLNNTKLEVLSLCKCDASITDEGLNELFKNCKNLREVLISKLNKITGDSIEALSKTECANNLRNLDLTGLKKVTELNLLNSFQHFKNLTTIYLPLTKGVTNEVVKTISSSCDFLQNIYLSGQSLLTDESIIFLSEKCKSLKVLNVSKCHKLTDFSIVSVSKNCADLKTIYLSKLTKLTPLSIQALADHSKFLKTLESSSCLFLINSNSIIYFFKKVENLSSLDITECTNISSEVLEILAPKLLSCTWLSMGGLKNIEDNFFKNVFNSFKINISVLNLSGTSITSYSVGLILKHIPLLRSLYLSNCEKIAENENQFDCGEENKLLEGLFLSENKNLSDELLLKILQKLNLLNHIVLRGCLNLTDFSLSKIPKMCPEMSLVDFSSCVKLTNETIFSLSKEASKLDVLKLRNIYNVQSNSIIELLKNCKILTTLVISGCNVNDSIGPFVVDSSSLTSLSLSGTYCTTKQAKIWQNDKLSVNLRGLN